MAVSGKKARGETASPSRLIPAIHDKDFALAISKVYDEYSEMIPDNDITSSALSLLTCLNRRTRGHFETIVRTVRDTLSTLDANKGFRGCIEVNSVDRAGRSTFSAAYALLILDNNPAAVSLRKSPRRAGGRAGGRVTSKTGFRFETGGQPA
jgi:hypothetical protein